MQTCIDLPQGIMYSKIRMEIQHVASFPEAGPGNGIAKFQCLRSMQTDARIP